MDDNWLAKIAKDGNWTLPGYLDVLQDIDAKVGHQHRRRTSMLDEIHSPIRRRGGRAGRQ